jgi:hypothetical protein
MPAGKIVLHGDGKIGVLSSGAVAVYDADGSCPECCCPCPNCSGDFPDFAHLSLSASVTATMNKGLSSEFWMTFAVTVTAGNYWANIAVTSDNASWDGKTGSVRVDSVGTACGGIFRIPSFWLGNEGMGFLGLCDAVYAGWPVITFRQNLTTCAWEIDAIPDGSLTIRTYASQATEALYPDILLHTTDCLADPTAALAAADAWVNTVFLAGPTYNSTPHTCATMCEAIAESAYPGDPSGVGTSCWNTLAYGDGGQEWNWCGEGDEASVDVYASISYRSYYEPDGPYTVTISDAVVTLTSLTLDCDPVL